MASVTAHVCDWVDGHPSSTATAVVHVTVSSGARFQGDLCAKHKKEFETFLTGTGGLTAHGVVGHKPRKLYPAKSGKKFTTADARAWAIEQGLMNGIGGRVSKKILGQYADVH